MRSKARFIRAVVAQLRCSRTTDYSLNLSTNYLVHGCYDSFNEFLHNCTNYDELLDRVQDYETTALKIALKSAAQQLIKLQ